MTEKGKIIINKDHLYMGIDFGDKKIGFAIGQFITTKSTPIKIVSNYKNQVNWAEIQEIISSWKPNVIIVGYPVTSRKNSFMKKLDKFIVELTEKYKDSIQVTVFSEVLSTEESKRIYGDICKSKYNIGKKDDLDDISACIILQSWFDENMIN